MKRVPKIKCLNCPERRRCRESASSWVFFIIGLIATISIRVVTVLISFNPVSGKVAWYVGVAGFFLFFVYKFRVNQARSKLIAERNLVEKVGGKRGLTDEDYALVSGILCSLSSRKEQINYFFIFGLSALALLVAIYIDFF